MIGDKSFVENVNYVAGLDGKFGSTVVLSADNIPVAVGKSYSMRLTVGTYSLETLESRTTEYIAEVSTAETFDADIAWLVGNLDQNQFTIYSEAGWNTAVSIPQKKVLIRVEAKNSTEWINKLEFSLELDGGVVVAVAGSPVVPKEILPKIANIPESFIADANRLADVIGASAPYIQIIGDQIVPNLDAILASKTNAEAIVALAATAQANVDAALAALNAVKSFGVTYTQLPAGSTPTAVFDSTTNIMSLSVPVGATGAAGKSIYELAVDAGFTGTLADFILTLKGQKGDTGVQGNDGAAGPQGPQGIQGIQGPAGATGAQGVSLVILGQVADVVSLPDPTGLTLDQAYIVQATGDLWFVDENHAWVNAGRIVGPQGDQGPQGIQGIDGPMGPRGLQGLQGPQGLTGATGAQGPRGFNGTNGTSITSVSSTKSGNVTTVTVAGDFVGAPYSFNVLDGSGSGDMMKSLYDPSGSGKVVAAVAADNVDWTGVANKPSAYPPLAHSHNEYVLVSTLGTMADFTAALG